MPVDSGFGGRWSRTGGRLRIFSRSGGRGIERDDRDGDDLAACRFHFFAADDLIVWPVASFNEDVGEEGGDAFRVGWIRGR